MRSLSPVTASICAAPEVFCSYVVPPGSDKFKWEEFMGKYSVTNACSTLSVTDNPRSVTRRGGGRVVVIGSCDRDEGCRNFTNERFGYIVNPPRSFYIKTSSSNIPRGPNWWLACALEKSSRRKWLCSNSNRTRRDFVVQLFAFELL